jgi:hypothetical protein
MVRKTGKPKDVATNLTPRFRAPRELRAVSTKVKQSSRRTRVAQICLSGSWLERLGFTPGTRFLVLADVPNQILLALIDL